MKKIHVKIGNSWAPVFCYMVGSVITCKDHKKALPSKATWGQDDLEFFKVKFPSQEFSLFVPGRAPI